MVVGVVGGGCGVISPWDPHLPGAIAEESHLLTSAQLQNQAEAVQDVAGFGVGRVDPATGVGDV